MCQIDARRGATVIWPTPCWGWDSAREEDSASCSDVGSSITRDDRGRKGSQGRGRESEIPSYPITRCSEAGDEEEKLRPRREAPLRPSKSVWRALSCLSFASRDLDIVCGLDSAAGLGFFWVSLCVRRVIRGDVCV